MLSFVKNRSVLQDLQKLLLTHWDPNAREKWGFVCVFPLPKRTYSQKAQDLFELTRTFKCLVPSLKEPTPAWQQWLLSS